MHAALRGRPENGENGCTISIRREIDRQCDMTAHPQGRWTKSILVGSDALTGMNMAPDTYRWCVHSRRSIGKEFVCLRIYAVTADILGR